MMEIILKMFLFLLFQRFRGVKAKLDYGMRRAREISQISLKDEIEDLDKAYEVKYIENKE